MAQIGDRVIQKNGTKIGIITDVWAYYNSMNDRYIVRIEVKYPDGASKTHDLRDLINLDD